MTHTRGASEAELEFVKRQADLREAEETLHAPPPADSTKPCFSGSFTEEVGAFLASTPRLTAEQFAQQLTLPGTT